MNINKNETDTTKPFTRAGSSDIIFGNRSRIESITDDLDAKAAALGLSFFLEPDQRSEADFSYSSRIVSLEETEDYLWTVDRDMHGCKKGDTLEESVQLFLGEWNSIDDYLWLPIYTTENKLKVSCRTTPPEPTGFIYEKISDILSRYNSLVFTSRIKELAIEDLNRHLSRAEKYLNTEVYLLGLEKDGQCIAEIYNIYIDEGEDALEYISGLCEKLLKDCEITEEQSKA